MRTDIRNSIKHHWKIVIRLILTRNKFYMPYEWNTTERLNVLRSWNRIKRYHQRILWQLFDFASFAGYYLLGISAFLLPMATIHMEKIEAIPVFFSDIMFTLFRIIKKYSNVFRENTSPPAPKPDYGGNFSHEAVTLKIRSRSPKSNKLLILSDLYRLVNLVTFHPMVHEITCRLTLFGLILLD